MLARQVITGFGQRFRGSYHVDLIRKKKKGKMEDGGTRRPSCVLTFLKNICVAVGRLFYVGEKFSNLIDVIELLYRLNSKQIILSQV